MYCLSMTTQTRMHSSRMRTARLLTVSQHALRRGGVCQQGLSARGDGGLSTWGVSAQACLHQRVSALGVVCPVRVSAQQGCLPRGVWQTPPVDRMTDRCKNITLSQLCCGGKYQGFHPQPAVTYELDVAELRAKH